MIELQTNEINSYDVIIIGGGAAGLMCAHTAAARGRRVVVLDHANKIGKKILMSGGGRCNFTNLEVKPSHFLSANEHFCKSALSRYSSADFIELVAQHGIPYHEKTQGQLFCDNKAKDILNMLESLCQTYGVDILTECSISRIEKNTTFVCHTSCGIFQAESLVIATGGKSIPSLGASGFGYDIARQFNLTVTETDASLVPFILTSIEQQALLEQLAGISFLAEVSCNGVSFKDGFLFTHRGLSGPAILQISNYWQVGMAVKINLLPNQTLKTLFIQWRAQKLKQTLKNALVEFFPKRFLEVWLVSIAAFSRLNTDKTVLDYSNAEVDIVSQHFHQWTVTPAGTEGYRTAEVTRGGVNTDEISSKTFESKKQPGLYFIGEVLDVTGHLGGFNFQWAWASGYCAGEFV